MHHALKIQSILLSLELQAIPFIHLSLNRQKVYFH